MWKYVCVCALCCVCVMVQYKELLYVHVYMSGEK